MSRSLIIALVVSLVLNGFAAGFIGARLVTPQPELSVTSERPPARGGDPLRMMRHVEVLSPESRDAFREAFRAQLPELRGGHREVRQLRGQLGVLMQAEEWDRAAVAAKFAEIDAAQLKQRDAINAAYMNAFEMLTPEERRLLIETAAAQREKRRKRFQRERFRRDQGEGPPPRE